MFAGFEETKSISKDELYSRLGRVCSVSILEVFEDFLNDLNVEIPNEEKQDAASDEIDICNLYGTQYGDLDESVQRIIREQLDVVYWCGKRDAYSEVISLKGYKHSQLGGRHD